MNPITANPMATALHSWMYSVEGSRGFQVRKIAWWERELRETIGIVSDQHVVIKDSTSSLGPVGEDTHLVWLVSYID